MTEELPSRADDILDELERSQRSEAVIRMKMVGLDAEALRSIADDEKRHQFERDIAGKVLAERAAAHARVDIDEPAPPLPWRLPEGNQVHAEAFAKILRDARLPCQVMGTHAIAGRGPVKDGWVVNYHDPDTEIGLVAAWWGRRHFTAYLEIAGHCDRTEETAELLVKAFKIARQQ